MTTITLTTPTIMSSQPHVSGEMTSSNESGSFSLDNNAPTNGILLLNQQNFFNCNRVMSSRNQTSLGVNVIVGNQHISNASPMMYGYQVSVSPVNQTQSGISANSSRVGSASTPVVNNNVMSLHKEHECKKLCSVVIKEIKLESDNRSEAMLELPVLERNNDCKTYTTLHTPPAVASTPMSYLSNVPQVVSQSISSTCSPSPSSSSSLSPPVTVAASADIQHHHHQLNHHHHHHLNIPTQQPAMASHPPNISSSSPSLNSPSPHGITVHHSQQHQNSFHLSPIQNADQKHTMSTVVAPVYESQEIGGLPLIEALPIGQKGMYSTVNQQGLKSQNRTFAQQIPMDNMVSLSPSVQVTNSHNVNNHHLVYNSAARVYKSEINEGPITGNVLPGISEMMQPKLETSAMTDYHQPSFATMHVVTPLSSFEINNPFQEYIMSGSPVSNTSSASPPLLQEVSSATNGDYLVQDQTLVEAEAKMESSPDGSEDSDANGISAKEQQLTVSKYQAIDRIETSINLVLNNSNNNLKLLAEKKEKSEYSGGSKKLNQSDIAFDPLNPDCNIHLWEFLLELLLRGEHRDKIMWTGVDYEFILKMPDQVAKLWGVRKAKPKMNYEKLARGLRYYYSKKILAKSSGRRYVYKFLCDISKSKVAKGKDDAIAIVKRTHTFTANFSAIDL